MAKLDELRSLAADLRKRLRQVDQLTGRASERDRDARRKRDVRATAKEVQIPPCEDPERRILLESDDREWLRWYFAGQFWYDFTFQQREMIEAIKSAILFGGDQAIAASRGEGKTKIFERTLLKYTLAGVIKFTDSTPKPQRDRLLAAGLSSLNVVLVGCCWVASVNTRRPAARLEPSRDWTHEQTAPPQRDVRTSQNSCVRHGRVPASDQPRA